MNKTDLKNKLTRTLGRTGLTLKKHSPEILVVTGVVGVVTSAVMACKATTKVNDLLVEAKENIEAIHAVSEKPENAEKYSEEDTKKALAITYAKTGVELVKLYGPAVALGTASIACILGGHNILRKRSAALAVAYTAVDRSFKDYRNRVIERFGEELDYELKHNIVTKEIQRTVVNEDGSETTVTETVNTIGGTYDPNNLSVYARIYHEGNKGWDENPEFSLVFLRRQQSYFNEVLQSRGYVLLNEVYEALGFTPTEVGGNVGWVYDEQNPVGDNFIDFGLYNVDNPRTAMFVNGDERGVILDFNVDGVIWDHIA